MTNARFLWVMLAAFAFSIAGCATTAYVDARLSALRRECESNQSAAQKASRQLGSDLAALRAQTDKITAIDGSVDTRLRELASSYNSLKGIVDGLDQKFSGNLAVDRKLISDLWEHKNREIREDEQRLSTALLELQEVVKAFEQVLVAQHGEVTRFLSKYDQLYGPQSEYERRKKAREVFAKAIDLHRQGLQKMDSNILLKATMQYKQGLLLMPKNAEMKLNLAKCLLARGNRDEALKLLCEVRGSSALASDQTAEVKEMLKALSKPEEQR